MSAAPQIDAAHQAEIAKDRPSSSGMPLLKKVREDYLSLRQLAKQIREDHRTHERDWTMVGFRAIAVHRFGVWADGVRLRLLRAVVNALYRFLYVYVRNRYAIELSRTTTVGRRLRIGHQGAIVFHPSAKIGDDCLIRHNVTVGAASPETMQGAPILMNRVEVGCGAVILGGIVIGDDVRIGPNAVVTMNVPAGATVVAPPPRIIQVRKPMSPPSPTADAAVCPTTAEPIPSPLPRREGRE